VHHANNYPFLSLPNRIETLFLGNNVWSIVTTDYAEEIQKDFGAEVVKMTLVL
jgi:hypothetical protein